uniref:Uncharacterized protein n=1 Tax=viral metagenome TaxID=1070528 RepID=A0A6C0EMF0_9ZZZZ
MTTKEKIVEEPNPHMSYSEVQRAWKDLLTYRDCLEFCMNDRRVFTHDQNVCSAYCFFKFLSKEKQ